MLHFNQFINENTIKSNQNKHTDIISEINEFFKLPISYNIEKKYIDNDIKRDLELNKVIDGNETPVFNHIFKPSNPITQEIVNTSCNYYTTNFNFLKDTQKLLTDFKHIGNNYDLNNITEIIIQLKNDNGFIEKYNYIDWEYWKFLNNSSSFLQLMSIYSIISPIISLLIPIFILIIPFFIIKIKGISITINEYISVLKSVASTNAIGKLFTEFNSVENTKKIYLIVSAAFYVFTIYQNMLACIRFHHNMTNIHNYIQTILEYIEYSIPTIQNFLNHTQSYKTYFEFNRITNEKLENLILIRNELLKISPYKLTITKAKELGNVLKVFYDIYCDNNFHETILYSLGFSAYLEIIARLQFLLSKQKITIAKLYKKSKKVNKSKPNNFKNMCYPLLVNDDSDNSIKNTYDFKNNNIITGPNASGKTTILKTLLINIILTQQYGCGFYTSANYTLYDYIHCYLNIPDTSGRDSLFQSETRKCNEIISSIKKNDKNMRHFCVFDELYSGTNPEEATKCGYAFLLYLSKLPNVHFSLTTHYLKICHKMDNINNVDNFQMDVDIIDNRIKYKYVLKKGITNVNGGVEILKQMNYPEEIMNTIRSIQI